MLKMKHSGSALLNPTEETHFNHTALNLSTTENLLEFNPEFHKLKTRILQTENFTQEDFAFNVYVGLYTNGTYIGYAKIFFRVSSGLLAENTMELGNETGKCKDSETLKKGVKNLISWEFTQPPFAKVNSSNTEANFSECEGGMTLQGWQDLVLESDANYVRTTVVVEFGQPWNYMKVKYKVVGSKSLTPCFYRAKRLAHYLTFMSRIIKKTIE